MKKIVILLVLVLLTGCGSNNTNSGVVSGGSSSSNATNSIETNEKAQAIPLKAGDSINLDFVEITIDESNIKDEYKFSSKESGIQMTYGKSAESGYKYIFLRGTIKNLDGNSIDPDSIVGNIVVNEKYNYKMDTLFAKNDASPANNIEPLITINYLFYAQIPDELANSFSIATFTFGFDDKFGNSRNAKVEDCEYIYSYTVAK